MTPQDEPGAGSPGSGASMPPYRPEVPGENATVDVVIPVYRPGAWLEACLDSVLASQDAAVRVWVVDDLPGDARVHAVAEARPGVELIVPPRNLRYASAVNLGIAAGTARYVLLLNQDAAVEPGCIARLAAWLDDDPALGVAGPRVLHKETADAAPDGLLDTAGIEMRRGRRSVDIGQGDRDDGRWAGRRRVFGVCAAVALYRRSALDRASRGMEVMDARFVMHKEDVDLAWRLQRLGYAAGVDGDAVAFHARGTGRAPDAKMADGVGFLRRARAILGQERGKSAMVRHLAWRNHLLLLIKNDTAAGLRAHLTTIIVLQLGYVATGLLLDPLGTVTSRLRAVRPLAAAFRDRRSWPPSDAVHVRPWLE